MNFEKQYCFKRELCPERKLLYRVVLIEVRTVLSNNLVSSLKCRWLSSKLRFLNSGDLNCFIVTSMDFVISTTIKIICGAFIIGSKRIVLIKRSLRTMSIDMLNL